MAAQEWDWFQREELIGQISDIRVQNLQVERENVQKRTFTRWMNLHLEKCTPPLEVTDLFIDIQDGKILMALLEVLSGRSLLHEYKSSSHRIFRLNNIAKALKFLEDSNVKLVSIDAAEIADGNPALVLGLVWNIILFFQIKELTGNLRRSSPSSSLSPGSGGTDSDSSFPATPTADRSAATSVKDQRKAIRALLAWVQRKTRKYGVAVQDFAGSWRSGLAFLAVIKAIDPSLVDMKQALEDSMRDNLEKAFSIAHDALHVPRLLEPEDVMVDTPDEQSVVTYVAQFLEHFPELEAEDLEDSDKEAPIESTFVRIKETPSERESTVFFLTENGDRAYTVDRDASHPPPSKVFVCDKPESVTEPCAGGVAAHTLSAASAEVIHQVIDQVLQGVPAQASSIGEPSPESSILLSRKDNRRSLSLPMKKMVHFEADAHQRASCSKDAFCGQAVGFAGSPRGTEDLLQQDGHDLAVGVAEEEPEQEAPKAPAVASAKAPGDASLAGGKMDDGPTSQGAPSGTGAPGGAGRQGEGRRPLSPLGENTVMADSSDFQVRLLTVEAVAEEGYFEGVPLKASKFNRDLVDFASTSQAFGAAPPPAEKRPAAAAVPGTHAETRGRRESKSARATQDADEPRADRGPQAAAADATPEVHGKAKRKSPRGPRDEDDGAADGGPQGQGRGRDPADPPGSCGSLETLAGSSEESLGVGPSPPASTACVVPLDLFYYPHYEVPLAAVLEAYAEGTEDPRDEECEPGPREPAAAPEGRPPGDSHQPQEPPDSEGVASPLEEKAAEESVSSKKKEKRKHVEHEEHSLPAPPSAVRSSDDLGDGTGDRGVLSRTSHSDSSIYARRHSNRSLDSDPCSRAQPRSAAEGDERRPRLSPRQASRSAEAAPREGDSLTRLVQRPDATYFIVFLWLLVYCLLLFPQLDVPRL